MLKKTAIAMFLLWGCLVAYNAKADDLKYLAHPQESLSAFLTIAERARVSIDLATFIFEPCHGSTQALMDVLTRKAREGVKVRLLLDATGHSNGEKQEIANFFARYGILVRYYNDYGIINIGANLRMHTKFMNVDSEIYISGGRNISDEYFAMSTKQNWVDRDVLVQGKSARQVTASFNEMWDDDMTNERPGVGSNFKGWPKYCGADLSKRAPEVKAFVAAKGADVLAAIPAHSCERVSFYTDHPQFGNPMYSTGGIYDSQIDTYMTPARLEKKRTTARILKFIQATKSKLEMENWGYIPTGFLREEIRQLRERGAKIRLVTNQDMESGPKWFQQAEEYLIKKFSTEDGVGTQRNRLVSSFGKLKADFELSPPNAHYFLHGKVFVRDNKDAVVSSFNLDSRSYSTNLESAVVVTGCPGFAADVKKQIDWVNAVYEADTASGKIPPKEEAGFFVKLFALMNITQF